jgi:hypothetical protein
MLPHLGCGHAGRMRANQRCWYVFLAASCHFIRIALHPTSSNPPTLNSQLSADYPFMSVITQLCCSLAQERRCG